MATRTFDAASQDEAFDAIAALIEEAHSIAICAHTSPDGDALGSQLALALLIEERWPGRALTCLLADSDPVPRIYSFLPGADRLVHVADYDDDPDLFVSVDLSVPHRHGEGQVVLERARKAAILDHHPCSDPYGEVALIRPDAAAAGVIIAEFANYLGVPITADMAQCLFCAIVTDTGRFQYQNADGEAFRIASQLVEAGASPSEVSLNVYQSYRLQYLHLKSAVMGRIMTFDHGRIAYSYATNEDLRRTGASLDECDGLIDVVRSVSGSELALFLKEVSDGKVRGNLRAKGTHDVSAVARAMGGGGHRAAAGFTVEGSVDDALCKVLPLLRETLKAEGDHQSGDGSW